VQSWHGWIFCSTEQQYRRSIVARVRYRHTCMRVRKMLVAAFILVISVAALVQFAAFTWRAGLLRVASEPLLDESVSSELASNLLQSKDFEDVTAYQRLCPEMQPGTSSNLRSVRIYHSFLQVVKDLTRSGEQGWAQREMALCTRYATVVLSQRMQRNQALAAEARSF
jgi:hypothetical protein